jgi:hypothetical protein
LKRKIKYKDNEKERKEEEEKKKLYHLFAKFISHYSYDPEQRITLQSAAPGLGAHC